MTPDREAVARYWNERIHDMEMTKHEPGSAGFFADLDAYRFDKLRYLPTVVDFSGFAGKKVLEIGCGLGLDLMRFARGGAKVTGIELSETALALASQYFESEGRTVVLERMDGEAMSFPDASFDVVYCHGVFPYAVDPAAIAAECRRVLKPDGAAIFMVYNRRGWLAYISKVVKAGLEHDDAPVFRPMSIAEFRRSLSAFQEVKIVPERFPVPTKLHKGLKGFLYNGLFVPGFNLIPRFLVRRLGWHLMAYCRR